MRKLEFELSEKQIAGEITDLHYQGLGFRKIAQEMTSKGYKMSKDTAHRIYRKNIHDQQEIEAEDKEIQLLKRREIRAQEHLLILQKKNALRKRINDLFVNEIMENFEKRKKIFSDENQLLKFADRVMPLTNPQLWQEFMDYCGDEYELSSMVAQALGPQRDFEEQVQYGTEKKELDVYLEKQLRETLKEWKRSDNQKNENQLEDDTQISIEIIDDYVNMTVSSPFDSY